MRLPDFIDEEEMKLIYSSVTALQQSEKGRFYKGEHRITRKTGAQRWGLFNISWTFDKSAGGNFYIAQVVDITDQKRIAQMKDEFVSTVSHELRTPLTSIKGALGLVNATNDRNLNADTQHLLEIASANTDPLRQRRHQDASHPASGGRCGLRQYGR
jgi:signal transduction histidine kinase